MSEIDLFRCAECDGLGFDMHAGDCACGWCDARATDCDRCGGTGDAPCWICGDRDVVTADGEGNLCRGCREYAGEDGGDVLEPARGGARERVVGHGRGSGAVFMGPNMPPDPTVIHGPHGPESAL
jgi:hypothetical protein